MKLSRRVILLIPSAREFDRALRRGIIEYEGAHGPWIFLEEAPGYLQSLTTRQRLRNIRSWNAEGMIVLQSKLGEVQSLRMPTIVAIGTHRLAKSVFQVVCADEEIGRMGARTLLRLGLRHFAYCGLAGLEFSDGRMVGFKKEIERAGFSASVYCSSTQHLGESWYVEQKEIARWLSDLPKPAALMACNDDRGRMVSEICRMQSIHVPDDIAILGVDNDEQVCRSSNPPLSSIAIAAERGGYDAAALLAAIMDGKRPARRVVVVHPTHVVARQSTDILAINDARLVRALRFIREHSNRNVRVGDLTSVACLSQRGLQNLFLRHLGRTPVEEIHRCRVERIGRLLMETNLAVGEIANSTGFESDAHFARFFSRRTGMTPRSYRRKHRPL